MSEVRAALAAAAAVGEFFALTAPGDDRWRPLRELVDDPAASRARVAGVRHDLAASARVPSAAVPVRTAASIDLQGLAARILSPALAAAALAGVAPRFAADALWFRVDTQRLALTDPGGHEVANAHQASDALHGFVVEPVIAPLVAAYAARHHVSAKVLWGNVASALHGALLVLDAARVPQRIAAGDVVTELVTALPGPTALSTAPRFVRNSCCLWYRIPGAAICGDCVLTAMPRAVSR